MDDVTLEVENESIKDKEFPKEKPKDFKKEKPIIQLDHQIIE